MRAVTGSSADECFCLTRCGVASMVFAALSVLILSARSETLGLCRRPRLSRGGKAGFGLVAQASQFRQVAGW